MLIFIDCLLCVKHPAGIILLIFQHGVLQRRKLKLERSGNLQRLAARSHGIGVFIQASSPEHLTLWSDSPGGALQTDGVTHSVSKC